MFGKKRLSLEDMGEVVDQDPILANTPEVEESTTPVVVEEVEQAGDKDARIAQLEAQVAELQEKLGIEPETTPVPVASAPIEDEQEEISVESYYTDLRLRASFEGIENIQYSSEAFSDKLKGFLAGTAIGGFYNKEKERDAEKLKKEIAHISDEILKVLQDGGRQAVKEGKVTAEQYKKEFDVPKATFWEKWFDKGHYWENIVYGPGVRGSRLAQEVSELEVELKEKMKKLNELLEKAAMR